MGVFYLWENFLSAILFLLVVVVQFCFSQEKPFWVANRTVKNSELYYFGIGSSKESFAESDAKARLEFAMNVEVKVKGVFQQEIKEEGEDFYNKTKISNELVSNVSLKGITITSRYSDTVYYSLIQYRKTEYDSLVKLGIQQEVELIKERNKAEEEKKKEEIRAQRVKDSLALVQKQVELKAANEKMVIEEQEHLQELKQVELRKKLYGEFLLLSPPEKVVTLRNGEITHGSTAVAAKMGLGPFQVRGLYAAYSVWKFEISANSVWKNKEVDQQEAFFKIQILPGVGEYYKTTLAIGASQAVGLISDSGYSFERSKYSFFISGNVAVPELYYSYISFYGDKRKIAVGINSHPFFKTFKNHIGFMLDIHIIPDKDFRDIYGDAFMIQGGIRLHASENLSTLFAYEGHERFMLTLEFQF